MPFNRDIEAYFKDEGPTADGFLVMKTFGPFKVDDARHMAELGTIVLAANNVIQQHFNHL